MLAECQIRLLLTIGSMVIFMWSAMPPIAMLRASMGNLPAILTVFVALVPILALQEVLLIYQFRAEEHPRRTIGISMATLLGVIALLVAARGPFLAQITPTSFDHMLVLVLLNAATVLMASFTVGEMLVLLYLGEERLLKRLIRRERIQGIAVNAVGIIHISVFAVVCLGITYFLYEPLKR